jgi:polar amino acid transport system substrate-binding protein
MYIAAAALAAQLLVTACDGAPTNDGAPTSAVIADVGTVAVNDALARTVPADVRATGLKIVTSAPYAPWETIKDRLLEGVDIDVAHALGARLGLKVNIESVDFQGVVPGVQAGKYNVAMAGIGDSREREKVFDFVDYARGSNVLVIKKGNPEDLSTFTDLCGKAVAYEQGSTANAFIESYQPLCAEAGKPEVQLQPYPSTSVTLALRSGKVSAYSSNFSNASALVKEQGDVFEVMRDPKFPDGYNEALGGQPAYYGIAVSKQVPGVADAIFAAMVSLGADGTTKKIFDKWGIGGIAVIPPLRNQATY